MWLKNIFILKGRKKMKRRIVQKRLLSIVLAGVLLFSSVDCRNAAVTFAAETEITDDSTGGG